MDLLSGDDGDSMLESGAHHLIKQTFLSDCTHCRQTQAEGWDCTDIDYQSQSFDVPCPLKVPCQ